MFGIVLFTLLISPYAYSERNAKWFFPRRTLTSVVHQRQVVTSVVPSSCVVIDSSLPTCRNVRRLDINPSRPTRIESTTYPQMVGPRGFNIEPAESFEHKGRSWGEGWIWSHQTITHTVINTQTIREYDPDAMVSIVFKGCKPTSLPFNLSPCDDSTSNATHQIERELHYAID